MCGGKRSFWKSVSLYSHFVVDLCMYPKIANWRGLFTGFCEAIEEFGHGAASGDDALFTACWYQAFVLKYVGICIKI